MTPQTTLFYDVDTQQDFLLPDGKLYVPGADALLPRLAQLTSCARRLGVRSAGSVDCHFSLDPELQANGGAYPEHCMAGTEGQRKVAATLPARPLWIENRRYPAEELQSVLSQDGDVFIEKQRFDVFSGNQNALYVFDSLLQGIEDLVVYGVVTEVCVDQAITGLKDRPVRVRVPLDAIAALSEAQGQATLKKWRGWGVELTTVAAVIASLDYKGYP